MTFVWFFVWFIWNLVGDHEPLVASPVNSGGSADLRDRCRPRRDQQAAERALEPAADHGRSKHSITERGAHIRVDREYRQRHQHEDAAKCDQLRVDETLLRAEELRQKAKKNRVSFGFRMFSSARAGRPGRSARPGRTVDQRQAAADQRPAHEDEVGHSGVADDLEGRSPCLHDSGEAEHGRDRWGTMPRVQPIAANRPQRRPPPIELETV